jgi:hypothetical protein
MNVIAFVFILAFAIVTGIAAWITKSLVALGLCLLGVGLIFEFASKAHTFTF